MDGAEERFNKILIKLQRRYGKDELVQSLNKTISELRVEVGQLKSYIESSYILYYLSFVRLDHAVPPNDQLLQLFSLCADLFYEWFNDIQVLARISQI